MSNGYRLRVYGAGHPLMGKYIEPVLPTPRLLSEGYRPTEAYEERPATADYPPVWRVRDDAYDPPGTAYTRVTVERIPFVWTCDDCGRTWTDDEEMGATFEAYAHHRCTP